MDPVESVSGALLLLLGIVVFNNYRKGTLGQWFGAKFLNAGAPTPAGYTATGGGSLPGVGSSIAGTVGAVGAAVGGWTLPVHGFTVTQLYGHNGHPGIDLAVPSGTPVFAAKAGTVQRASLFAGYGNCIDIDHGSGLLTRYGHLQSYNVKAGDHVNAGQQIGQADSTGESTGPHLHFEIRLNGATTDPAPYLGIPETVGYKAA